jgi:hypothetical protein
MLVQRWPNVLCSEMALCVDQLVLLHHRVVLPVSGLTDQPPTEDVLHAETIARANNRTQAGMRISDPCWAAR